MNVSAIIVTKGDHPIRPVMDSLPYEWEQVIWDNGAKQVSIWNHDREEPRWYPCDDLKVYGRYAAIEHASHNVIYVQDDDCFVSDPQAIVDEWGEIEAINQMEHVDDPDHFVVCNMPERFRHEFYEDNGLVGFGACFIRDAPARAFRRFFPDMLNPDPAGNWWGYTRKLPSGEIVNMSSSEFFHRTCDIAFTGLTPRVLVDVEHMDREFASDPDRMWRQTDHTIERGRMRDIVRMARQRKDT